MDMRWGAYGLLEGADRWTGVDGRQHPGPVETQGRGRGSSTRPWPERMRLPDPLSPPGNGASEVPQPSLQWPRQGSSTAGGSAGRQNGPHAHLAQDDPCPWTNRRPELLTPPPPPGRGRRPSGHPRHGSGTRESSRTTGYDGFAHVRRYEIGLFEPFPLRASVGRGGILCQVHVQLEAEVPLVTRAALWSGGRSHGAPESPTKYRPQRPRKPVPR